MATKTIKTIDDLANLISNTSDLYVRWSRGPAMDRKQGASRDYASGGYHDGLSAVPVDPAWATDDVWMATRVTEYRFLRMKGGKINCWLYTGETVGHDSDGYDAIENIEAVGKLSESLIAELVDLKN